MSDFDLYESEIEELYRPKEEPKVWLTVGEAKRIVNELDYSIVVQNEIAVLTGCWIETSNEEGDICMLQERIGNVEAIDK